MAETETAEPQSEPTTDPVEPEPVEVEVPAEPPAEEPAAPVTPAATQTTAQPIDIETELTAKESLADQLDRGDISLEDYAKKVAKVDRNIAQAQRQAIQPVQQVIQQQQAARQYWGNWGKGSDVAQATFAKSVPAAKARQLFDRVQAEVMANPRYANRPEIDPQSIIYDKWMDALASEKAKPTPATPTRTPAPIPAGTRVTGAAAANNTAPATEKSARQKLDDGDYGDLGAEMRNRLGV